MLVVRSFLAPGFMRPGRMVGGVSFDYVERRLYLRGGSGGKGT